MTIDIDGSQPLSAATVSTLARCCERVESVADPLEFRLSGVPRHIGGDGLDIALVTRWERTLRRLEQAPAVTIARVEGDCGGVALDVLLATDLRVAAPGTRLVVPLGAEATWPGMAGFRLVQQAGAAGARRALLLGDPIEATTALGLGLLDAVTDGAVLPVDLRRRLERVSGTETAIRRRLMLDAASTSFEEALGAHLAACDRTLRRTAIGAR